MSKEYIEKQQKDRRRRNSHQSFLDSESLDEDDLLKVDFKRFQRAKFTIYNRYLNVLLLKTGDPFVAEMYSKYLKIKRKGRE